MTSRVKYPCCAQGSVSPGQPSKPIQKLPTAASRHTFQRVCCCHGDGPLEPRIVGGMRKKHSVAKYDPWDKKFKHRFCCKYLHRGRTPYTNVSMLIYMHVLELNLTCEGKSSFSREVLQKTVREFPALIRMKLEPVTQDVDVEQWY